MSIRNQFLAVTAALLLIVTACSPSSNTTAQGVASTQDAVVVTYPNGGGTTVFLRPMVSGGQPTVLCTSGTKVCPYCEAAAAKYFQTGVLDSKCSLTGGTRAVATYVNPSLSVN
ncbi:MAG TPA: hypothetical protein VMD30_08425 [Tepidisphaeraceae bacterium]|nr:hypothetical protein [Tepidisphaeraceae bacterium]